MEEGIEWDTVEVEFNESLINAFHQVKPLKSVHNENRLCHDLHFQEGGLLQVFELPSVAEMKAGVGICCHFSSDTCFMSGDGDQFTLAHFTGEFDYVINSQWMTANQVHVAGSKLRTVLQTSSCDLLVDMAQVINENSFILLGNQSVCVCVCVCVCCIEYAV